MEKIRIDNQGWNYPGLGGRISIPLVSRNKRENFMLDISRGRIDLVKGTYQNRAHQVVVLVRLDFGGQPHRNPDGQEISSPHLHVYREGYGDKWAVSVPQDKFPNTGDLWQLLEDFMRYCNVAEPPNIERGLFI
ncbi:MAG: hypothetical protein KJ893_00410 [Candidatus Omnitrophica bacterium]|nr:hypothetical protein [Candidatus Omnitrophota bacterium]MBU4479341.1 hypothetical protein [Candidatus Omnitrophota bacterium]